MERFSGVTITEIQNEANKRTAQVLRRRAKRLLGEEDQVYLSLLWEPHGFSNSQVYFYENHISIRKGGKWVYRGFSRDILPPGEILQVQHTRKMGPNPSLIGWSHPKKTEHWSFYEGDRVMKLVVDETQGSWIERNPIVSDARDLRDLAMRIRRADKSCFIIAREALDEISGISPEVRKVLLNHAYLIFNGVVNSPETLRYVLGSSGYPDAKNIFGRAMHLLSRAPKEELNGTVQFAQGMLSSAQNMLKEPRYRLFYTGLTGDAQTDILLLETLKGNLPIVYEVMKKWPVAKLLIDL